MKIPFVIVTLANANLAQVEIILVVIMGPICEPISTPTVRKTGSSMDVNALAKK